MTGDFIVRVNNQIVHSHKSTPIPARLRRFFEEMDRDMLNGVQLGDDFIAEPSDFQKQQYIASILINSLESNDLNTVQIMSAYLSRCNLQLTEIFVTSNENIFNMTLITK